MIIKIEAYLLPNTPPYVAWINTSYIIRLRKIESGIVSANNPPLVFTEITYYPRVINDCEIYLVKGDPDEFLERIKKEGV